VRKTIRVEALGKKKGMANLFSNGRKEGTKIFLDFETTRSSKMKNEGEKQKSGES